MNAKLLSRLMILVLCASFVVTVPVQAQSGGGQIGASNAQITGVIIGIVVAGAAIGVGVYLLVRKAPSITGCAVSSPIGLSLQNEGDQQTYTLIGDTANIKSGNRVRVSGKRNKREPSGKHDFVVDKLAKDYGPCKTLAVAQ